MAKENSLVDINWLHLGKTNEYATLKKDIAHVCRDVTNAACIDEICINDILVTFKQHGYIVRKCDGKNNETSDSNCTIHGVIASTWIFFYEGEEDKPQFKVQANAQWEAYQAAQEHFGDQVEDMMYKIL